MNYHYTKDVVVFFDEELYKNKKKNKMKKLTVFNFRSFS